MVSAVPVPESGQYVIIGGGTAATAAGRAIRRIDPVAKVRLRFLGKFLDKYFPLKYVFLFSVPMTTIRFLLKFGKVNFFLLLN